MIGILTMMAPLLFLVLAIGGYWYIRECIRIGSPPSAYFRSFIAFCLVTWGTLFVFYMLHFWRTRLIPPEKRGIWLGALWGLNVFAYPVYWYRFIWKQRS